MIFHFASLKQQKFSIIFLFRDQGRLYFPPLSVQIQKSERNLYQEETSLQHTSSRLDPGANLYIFHPLELTKFNLNWPVIRKGADQSVEGYDINKKNLSIGKI